MQQLIEFFYNKQKYFLFGIVFKILKSTSCASPTTPSPTEALFTRMRFQIDTVLWPRNRIENDTGSKCLHGARRTVVLKVVIVLASAALRARFTMFDPRRPKWNFTPKYSDRFQIDAVSPFTR